MNAFEPAPTRANPTLARIRKALSAGYPLVYVRCHEEDRLERMLNGLADAHFGSVRPVVSWSLTDGFGDRAAEARPDPLEALRQIAQGGQEAFYLLKDFPLLLAGRPELVRGLRDLYRSLLGSRRCVFLSCSELCIPDALSRQVFLVELGAPDQAEILAELKDLGAVGDACSTLTDGWFAQVAASMKGMMLNEVRHLMRRLVAERRLDIDVALTEVREEKAAALMREACLKYIASTVDIDQVGGLENLKDWVLSRRSFFTGEDVAAGVPLPSGVLFMGVSGCGKSMAAKVIASAWKLPLVRLDMNLVLSGAFGSPEYAFDHALQVAEQIAPMVLWIDEMENSFGYDSDLRGGNNPNIFSSFLTWMQEKPAGVFVVATANRIEKLPAEVIRKGRFDQLFFLDLPTEAERTRIIDIHLRAAGADPAAFNLKTLSVVTRNWSGAEIEQAIKAAVVHAWQEQRAFNERDVLWSTSRIVPLSHTMAEQIKALRNWSQERATPASRKAVAGAE
ncbi:AAA family ATPase [Rhodocyclaceae bacterium SMB388]